MLTILVDLDGTIIDPAAGILASYRHAFTQFGVTGPDDEHLRTLIGPPLRTSFAKLLGPGGDVERAVALYREHYGVVGMYEAIVYPGMAEALAALRALPARLFVATAKAQRFAAPIVAHFGLAHVFDAVHGPDLAGRHDDKAELIAHMVAVEGIDPARAIMVGDRENDVRAARHHGIPTIGALWGYGDAEELNAAGAAALCATPGELVEAVRKVANSE